jgi:hypothetical protein
MFEFVLNEARSGHSEFSKTKTLLRNENGYFYNSNLFLRCSPDRTSIILTNVIKCIEYVMNFTPPPFMGEGYRRLNSFYSQFFPLKNPLVSCKPSKILVNQRFQAQLMFSKKVFQMIKTGSQFSMAKLVVGCYKFISYLICIQLSV